MAFYLAKVWNYNEYFATQHGNNIYLLNLTVFQRQESAQDAFRPYWDSSVVRRFEPGISRLVCRHANRSTILAAAGITVNLVIYSRRAVILVQPDFYYCK